MFFTTKLATLFTATCIGLANVVVAFHGDATYYHTGLGNCGAWSQDTDFVVALSTHEYNNAPHCWQHIQVHYQGRTIDATVVDSCPGCSQYSIDLSPAAFQALAPLDAGRIQVDWNY